jgi:hypothetical protein
MKDYLFTRKFIANAGHRSQQMTYRIPNSIIIRAENDEAACKTAQQICKIEGASDEQYLVELESARKVKFTFK